MEDQDAHAHGIVPAACRDVALDRLGSRREPSQRYRMRTPSTGREIVLEAEPGEIYRDRETGEELEVVGKVLPLAPSPSQLPWAVENLRFCNWCDQLAQKDLNDCPTCGRRMDPLGRCLAPTALRRGRDDRRDRGLRALGCGGSSVVLLRQPRRRRR